MGYGVKIEYECASCGAEAVSVPDLDSPAYRGSRVMVPHLRGCPVAVQVARAKARALAGAKR